MDPSDYARFQTLVGMIRAVIDHPGEVCQLDGLRRFLADYLPA